MKTRSTLAALVLLLGISMPMMSQTSQPKYKDPNLSAHERAVDLCSQLTLEEKGCGPLFAAYS